MENLGQENEYTEHKESLAQLDKGIKSMTAMLNKHYSAKVNFGVDDNGNVIGVHLGKRSLDDIRERIAVLVQPKPSYEITTKQTIDNKTYLILTANGTDIPYSCDGRYYIRNIKSDDLMDNSMIRRAIIHGSYDALKETKSPIQKLSFQYFYNYLLSNGIHVRYENEFLENYGLINSEGTFNYTALLLSDKNDISIKVVRFSGTKKSTMSSRTDFGNSSILTACQAVLDHVKSTNITKVNLSEGKRVEETLFDYESFREAWINACVHNDWLHMIPPSVFIYDDRIEISSYGSIPFNMSKDDFFKGKSRPINPSLFNIFAISSFAEQSGHGIPTIVEHYTEQAFDFSSNCILVTIPFAFTPDAIVARNQIEINGLQDNHKKVLVYLISNPESTLRDCAINVGLSLSGVKKIVKILQDDGKIKRIGPKNGGVWSI